MYFEKLQLDVLQRVDDAVVNQTETERRHVVRRCAFERSDDDADVIDGHDVANIADHNASPSYREISHAPDDRSGTVSDLSAAL